MSATLVNTARLQTLLGAYHSGRADALTEASYHLRAQDARRQLSARMTPVDREGIRSQFPDAEYLVSRKIDGEFTCVVCDGGQAVTINPGGTVRYGLPLLQEVCERLNRSGIKQAILLGELYVRRTDRRPRVHDVVRVARQPESQADVDSLCFAVFDLIQIDGVPAPDAYASKLGVIEKAFGEGDRVHPVETRSVRTTGEIEALFQKWVEEDGGEGLVVRSADAGLFKVKPRHNLDVAVIGFTEGLDDRAGLIHDLLVAVMRPEGLLQILGRVGGGFSEDDRRNWLSDLKDAGAESEYAEVNDQVAYRFVRPERVIEISCLDLIGQNTRGAAVERAVLNWDAPASTYRPIRRLPLCAPISPQFVRIRDDKQCVPEDIRIQQLTTLLDVPMSDLDASALVLPASEILHRAAYTKVLKGQTLVRKLMLWQTNKDQHDSDYPAYVAYVTDFSPNRSEPLKRDIRVSSCRDQIQHLLRELNEQYVVKGWELAC